MWTFLNFIHFQCVLFITIVCVSIWHHDFVFYRETTFVSVNEWPSMESCCVAVRLLLIKPNANVKIDVSARASSKIMQTYCTPSPARALKHCRAAAHLVPTTNKEKKTETQYKIRNLQVLFSGVMMMMMMMVSNNKCDVKLCFILSWKQKPATQRHMQRNMWITKYICQ